MSGDYRVRRPLPDRVTIEGPTVYLVLTDDEAEALAADLLQAVPISDEHKAILEEAIREAEGQRVPLVLQTQEGLPDQPESFTRKREPTHGDGSDR
jgi:hypothetical protein